jgi:xanthine dehydrogenase accessory factor
MNDVLDSLEKWRQGGEQIAVATVVETWGSAPRPVGSKLITTLSGGIAGSVSAGCVEGAVIHEGKAVVESGQPRLVSYGVADDDAWEVGLACGGTIRVFVEPFSALSGIYPALKRSLEARQPMAVVSVLEGAPEHVNRKLIVSLDGSTEGDLSIPEHAGRIVEAALEWLAQGTGGTLELDDETTVFIEVYPPVPRLVIVGAMHIAESLVTMANEVGFDTCVVDPRTAFNNEGRFPHADYRITEWPQKALPALGLDRSAYVVILTHDPKLDHPALQAALRSDARYVGALGSRRTNEIRRKRLREAGFGEEEIARLHAPIGLPLGGRSPAEIAVSIMAQVVQARNNVLAQQPALDRP